MSEEMTREQAIDGLKRIKHNRHLSHTNDDEIMDMAIAALEAEPCEDAIAKERYEDLCEYFGDAKDILKNREEFKKWLDRVKWHIRKAEELYEKYEYKKEPCSDAISRQAVLEQTYLWSKDEFLRVTNPFDYLRKRINSLQPVILQQTRWIPVSERLPEDKKKHYLVTVELTFSRGDRYITTKCGNDDWEESKRYGHEILAWMLLPKPYKEEQE